MIEGFDALSRTEFEDAVDVARRMKAGDVEAARYRATRRVGPMCGPHLDEGTVERQKLVADAILLERAQAALLRRNARYARSDLFTDLGAIALLWRTQAEAPG